MVTRDTLLYAQDMRDRETIDSELRMLAAERRSIRARGGEPSNRQVDRLLDERLGHLPEASETDIVADARSRRGKTDGITSFRRKGVLPRFGFLAALPLSLIAVATAIVVMFAVHNPHPAAQPTEVPPPSARPNPPPSGARPNPAPPKAHVPPLDIADRAFMDALKQEGVPVPSQEYVMTHGHAVCDFMARQPNVSEAIRFVQRSSIWDANQSAEFAAGAIVSYCPQYQPASPDEMQQTFQNALSDLQAIQGDLQGIRDDLHGIPGQP
jgi:hypothetical protein